MRSSKNLNQNVLKMHCFFEKKYFLKKNRQALGAPPSNLCNITHKPYCYKTF